MKRILLSILSMLVVLACATPAAALTQPAAEVAAPTTASTGTTLYISATMHIESQPDSWPKDVDAYIAFIEQLVNAGVRLSVGADVGWLTGGVRVQEIIQRTSVMGVQWDVHAHKQTDRAKAAYLLTKYGVTPTSVISGMQISEFDRARRPSIYKGYTWTPKVVWGGVNCVGHRPGCDDTSIALYRPTSSVKYYVHDPKGNIVRVGNSDHQLATAETMITQISDGQYTVPVLSFTIMIEPETLQIVNSDDSLNEILAFVERVKQNSAIRFATIEETAQAWVNAGSVPILIP
jgi:hypothetical protein